jgi:hypothetical protein
MDVSSGAQPGAPKGRFSVHVPILYFMTKTEPGFRNIAIYDLMSHMRDRIQGKQFYTSE